MNAEMWNGERVMEKGTRSLDRKILACPSNLSGDTDERAGEAKTKYRLPLFGKRQEM